MLSNCKVTSACTARYPPHAVTLFTLMIGNNWHVIMASSITPLKFPGLQYMHHLHYYCTLYMYMSAGGIFIRVAIWLARAVVLLELQHHDAGDLWGCHSVPCGGLRLQGAGQAETQDLSQAQKALQTLPVSRRWAFRFWEESLVNAR